MLWRFDVKRIPEFDPVSLHLGLCRRNIHGLGDVAEDQERFKRNRVRRAACWIRGRPYGARFEERDDPIKLPISLRWFTIGTASAKVSDGEA